MAWAKAKTMIDADARETMLAVAASCQKLAERIEQKSDEELWYWARRILEKKMPSKMVEWRALPEKENNM
jgi:hypothetical protein